MNFIKFNNKRSDELGIYVSTFPTYPYPEKDIETATIPGRNGNIIFDMGTYKNVQMAYDVSIYEPMFNESATRHGSISARMKAITEWLHPATYGYCELSDTYYDDYNSTNGTFGYHRLAICKNAGQVENLLNTVGRATIIFECRPERFKNGMQFWLYTQGGTIQNSTKNIASFDIRTVNGYEARFKVENANYPRFNSEFWIASGSSITINGDTLDAGSKANNARINVATAMPRLVPGNSTLTVLSGRVEVRVNEWIL